MPTLALAITFALAAFAQAPPPPVAQWQPFTAERGLFKVSLPARPTARKRTVELGGKPVEVVAYSVQRRSYGFSVAVGELAAPPADAQPVLDGLRDDAVKQLRATLMDEKPAELNGLPGRELRLALPRTVMAGGGQGEARVYVVGKRVYEVAAVLGNGLEAVDPAPFFESFRPQGLPSASVKGSADSVAVTIGGTGKPPQGKITPAAGGWFDLRADEAHYAASFPGRPAELVQDHEAHGRKVTFHVAYVAKGESRAFSVIWFPNTDGRVKGKDKSARAALESQLGDYLEGALKSQHATLESQAKLTVAGWPALDFAMQLPREAKATRVVGRYVATPETMFQVLCVLPPGTSDAEAKRFVAAFRPLVQADAEGAANLADAGPAAAQGQPASAAWQRFAPEDAGFSIMMPGEGEEKTDTRRDKNGERVAHSVIVRRGPTSIFQVVWVEHSPTANMHARAREVRQALRKMAEDMLSLTAADDRPMIVPGAVAQELHFKLAPPRYDRAGELVARTYDAGDRYFLLFASHSLQEKGDDVKKFLDSFRILDDDEDEAATPARADARGKP